MCQDRLLATIIILILVVAMKEEVDCVCPEGGDEIRLIESTGEVFG